MTMAEDRRVTRINYYDYAGLYLGGTDVVDQSRSVILDVAGGIEQVHFDAAHIPAIAEVSIEIGRPSAGVLKRETYQIRGTTQELLQIERIFPER